VDPARGGGVGSQEPPRRAALLNKRAVHGVVSLLSLALDLLALDLHSHDLLRVSSVCLISFQVARGCFSLDGKQNET